MAGRCSAQPMPASDATLATAPPSGMTASTCSVTSRRPRKLTWNTRSGGWVWGTPATLKSLCTGAPIAVSAVRTEAGSPTSVS